MKVGLVEKLLFGILIVVLYIVSSLPGTNVQGKNAMAEKANIVEESAEVLPEYPLECEIGKNSALGNIQTRQIGIGKCEKKTVSDKIAVQTVTENVQPAEEIKPSLQEPNPGIATEKKVAPPVALPSPVVVKHKLECPAKHDRPTISSRYGQNHMDEDCCPDYDEWPKPNCNYSPEDFVIMLKGPKAGHVKYSKERPRVHR